MYFYKIRVGFVIVFDKKIRQYIENVTTITMKRVLRVICLNPLN